MSPAFSHVGEMGPGWAVDDEMHSFFCSWISEETGVGGRRGERDDGWVSEMET